jgi:hypothetical protein
VEDAFAIVLFVVVGIAFVAAVWALVTSRGSYDQIGAGGLSTAEKPTTDAEREAEIRQMLDAANVRRTARGEQAHDVDAEFRALTASADPGLREEVRQLVEARNARRVARGEEPLDVEAEIEQQLRELGAG